MSAALRDAMSYCANVMELPADVAARRAALIAEPDATFPLDEESWCANLDVAMPLLRRLVLETLGGVGERLSRDAKDTLTEALVETLDEVGLDMPLSENELCDLATSQRAVGMARSMWLHCGCPSRIVGPLAIRMGDQSLIPVWRKAVEREEWLAEMARQEREEWFAEDEDDGE